MSADGPPLDGDDTSPDDDLEPIGAGALLPPEDRLWRHPSELAGLGIGPSVALEDRHPAPRRPERTRTSVLLVSCTALAAFTLGVALALGLLDPPTDSRQYRADDARVTGPAANSTISANFTPVAAQRAAPAVARLRVTNAMGTATASAVVLGPAGHLVTSSRLLTGVLHLEVSLKDGRTLSGRVAGIDPVTGLGVIAVDATDLYPPEVTRGLPRRGDIALTVGGPPAATRPARGVVTAVGMPMHAAWGTLHDMIETSRGSRAEDEGGALVDEHGVLLGISISPGVAAAGPGWAVPIDVATRVTEDIAENGYAHHAWLGLAAMESGDMDDGRVSFSHSVAVSTVEPNSPAARAGLQPGDEITAIDGKAISTPGELISVLRRCRPNQQVTIVYRRNDHLAKTTATLGELSQ